MGKRQVNKKLTDEKAVVVLVSKKVPEEALRKEELIPRQLEGKSVDVMEIGEVCFLGEKKKEEGEEEEGQGENKTRITGTTTPSSAVTAKKARKYSWSLSEKRAQRIEMESLKERTGKHRPAIGGISIGHYLITAGTLGAAVYDKAGAGGDRKLFALSNNHVLANSSTGNDGRAARGDKVLQPGAYDGGRDPDDTWGYLERFVPLKKGKTICMTAFIGEKIINQILAFLAVDYRVKFKKNNDRENLVDAAVAKPIMDGNLSTEILGLGKAAGIAEANVGQEVVFSGRTSGIRKGVVLAKDVHISVAMEDGEPVMFADQLVTSAIALPGDSGSLLLDNEKNAVGLIFAGSDIASIGNRMENVAALLQIEI